MYLSYYNLTDKPFSISTDPKYLWLGEKHKEAYSVLKYGVLDNKGFLLLTGDIGAGKTTLIHALTTSMGSGVIWATVPDPGLELMDFYQFIANEFNMEGTFTTKSEFIKIFRCFLHQSHANRKKVLLIIDEAQRLSNELLEEIRMLSNIELNEVKLLNIFFVGQIEFIKILKHESNRAVKHRITVNYHIKPLSDKETGRYIRHRLKIAGAKRNIFSFVAINQIHEYSKGCPRIINILCDMAMLTGYSRNQKKIGFDIVDESIESIQIVEQPIVTDTADTKNGNNDDQKSRKRFVLVVFFLAIVFSVGIVFSGLYKTELLIYLGLNDRQGDAIHEIKPDAGKPDNELSENGSLIKSEPELSVNDDHDNMVDKSREVNDQASSVTNNDFENQIPQKFEKLIVDFSHNSNEFSDDVYGALDLLSEYMKRKPGVGVFISGYTDDYGSYSYNVNLSSFRANTVRSYLIGSGIDKSRIKATGFGSANPVASNVTSDGRKANRRVEIEVFNN